MQIGRYPGAAVKASANDPGLEELNLIKYVPIIIYVILVGNKRD